MHFLLEKVNFYCHASLLEGNNPSTPTFQLSNCLQGPGTYESPFGYSSRLNPFNKAMGEAPPGGEARSRTSAEMPLMNRNAGNHVPLHMDFITRVSRKLDQKWQIQKNRRLLNGFIFTGNPYTPQKLRQITSVTQQKTHFAPPPWSVAPIAYREAQGNGWIARWMCG